MFGKYGIMIWEYANGIDNSEVNYLPEKPKCIGNSKKIRKKYLCGKFNSNKRNFAK